VILTVGNGVLYLGLMCFRSVGGFVSSGFALPFFLWGYFFCAYVISLGLRPRTIVRIPNQGQMNFTIMIARLT
jgi:hypothetical protein